MGRRRRSSSISETWNVQLTDGAPPWHILPGGIADRADALRVREIVYCQELGYRWGSPSDEYDSRAILCLVRSVNGEAIGSFRIVGPTARPFEVDRFLRLDEILPPNSRPAEMNRFCVLAPYRSISSSLHLALFKFSLDLARRDHLSHFVLAAKPSIAPIYRYLGFDLVSGTRFEHTGLGGDLHDLFVMDLGKLEERYASTGHPLARLLGEGEK
jgi:hypothetical protein